MKALRFFIVLFALLLAFPSMADNRENALVVWTKDGAKTTFILLNERPTVTFVNNGVPMLSVTQASQQNAVMIPLNDVARFTYEKVEDPDGVKPLVDESSPVNYDADGAVIISDVQAGTPVAIYSIDGQLKQQLTPRTSGTYKVPLSGLVPGTYLLKAGSLTTKIIKR